MDAQPDDPRICERCLDGTVEDDAQVCPDCQAEIVRDFQQARETDLRIDEAKEEA